MNEGTIAPRRVVNVNDLPPYVEGGHRVDEVRVESRWEFVVLDVERRRVVKPLRTRIDKTFCPG